MTSEKQQTTPHPIDAGMHSMEQIERIWAQRAEQFAQVEGEEEAGEQIEILLVSLGGEQYGLEVRYVTSVRPRDRITRIPRLPEWIAGIVHLRGRMLSVIDLRLYLGLPQGSGASGESFVFVQTPAMQVVFLVDDVASVEEMPLREQRSGDREMHHLPAGYVRAVVEARGDAVRQQYITVLDVAAILSDPRLIIHQELG